MPVLFVLDTTLTPNMDGTATLDSVWHSLSTAPAEMVIGDPFPVSSPVAADGTFTFALKSFPIYAAGNPVTGSDLVVDANLNGTIRSTDRFCGGVVGMVIQPAMIDLTGSTWSATRVSATAIGSELPPSDHSCPAESPDGGTDPDGGT
jgi:hypothetical protein